MPRRIALLLPLCCVALTFSCGSSRDERDSASGGVGAGAQPTLVLVGGGGASSADTPPSGASSEPCGSVDVPSTLTTSDMVVEVPGNVLFVVDQSSSMIGPWGEGTKWSIGASAVTAAFSPLADRLSAGAIFFPTVDIEGSDMDCDWLNDFATCAAQSCASVAPLTKAPQIAVTSGAQFLSRWQAWVSRAPTGIGTPTESALRRAEAALEAPAAGNTALVLITDGEPTCGTNEVAVVSRLLERGIKTFVVGLPGAAGTRVLDAIAVAGGTAPAGCASSCFISPADAASLQDALSSIASKTVSSVTSRTIEDCSFALEAPPRSDPAQVHLVVTDAVTQAKYEIPRPMGWDLQGGEAVLSEATCAAGKAGAFSSLTFHYGCVRLPTLPR